MSWSVHIGPLRKLCRIKGQAVGYGSKERKGPERLMWVYQNLEKNPPKNLPTDFYMIPHNQL